MTKFRDAVKEMERTLNVEIKCASGLQALERAHRGVVRCGSDEWQICGSIFLDRDLAEMFPEDTRWDYAVGVQKGGRCEAVWIEIHRAHNVADVRKVIKKAKWLDEMLEANPKLKRISRKPYVWIAAGKNTISKTTSGSRLLAKMRSLIAGPKRRVECC